MTSIFKLPSSVALLFEYVLLWNIAKYKKEKCVCVCVCVYIYIYDNYKEVKINKS